MIRVDVDATQMVERLRNLSGALGDMRPIWEAIHPVFTDFIKQLFTTQGGYVGSAWAPLSPGYARWKQSHGFDQGINRLRDRMYRSLIEPGHGEHVFRSGPSWAEYGTSVPYARFAQTGTRSMPARPPIKPFSRTEGERVVDVVLAYLLKSARRGTR